MKTADKKFTQQKDRKKTMRVILQSLILLMLAAACIFALVTLKAYEPYGQDKVNAAGDKGFIALAYFGVDRNGDQTLIAQERLREELQALKDLGYVTISQQDVLDYYAAGKPLPERALFLLFEDGRRDTAIFAQKILEDMNFKATMLTYADKFAKKDTKFLRPEELKSLVKTSYWELGTNGYRLEFINVFDRYDNYLGEIDPLKYSMVVPYLGRNYNHYLMDYIRDEYGVPKESYVKMKERISYDYEAMRDIYTKSVGDVPSAYILMHSNTGSFGNNDKVSAVNDYWIKNLFKMNFNREGFCLNQRNSSVYDLTRMQPQAYWFTNHLLMRVKYATNQDIDFVKGNMPARQNDWDTLNGALEIKDETMVLTSEPKGSGLLRLRGSGDFSSDLKLSVRLRGNKVGLQKIYLRADDNRDRFIAVYLLNNVLFVTEKNNGTQQQLCSVELDPLDGKAPVSVPEDKKAAEMQELKAFTKYASSVETARIYAERLKDRDLEEPATVSAGADRYVPELSLSAKGDRQVDIALKGAMLDIRVDGKTAVSDLVVADSAKGQVYLESGWGGFGWSQRNLADTVYDGVFEQLLVTENTGAEKEQILFDGRLHGIDAVKLQAKQYWRSITGWFVTNL